MAWFSKNFTKWRGEREGATWNSLIFSWNSLFATWNSLTAAGEWFSSVVLAWYTKSLDAWYIKLSTGWFTKKYSSG